MRKLIAIISLILIAGLGVLFANQFLIMPWDGSDLIKTSKQKSEKKEKAPTLTNVDLPKMKNPKIVIKKKDRTLEVFESDKLVKTYKIALGSEPVGDKEIEGDGKTPEGEFYIFTKNPKSSFYLSLGVSYPSIDDAKRGLENELITKDQHDKIVSAIKAKKTPLQKTKLGGEIYIHGSGNLTDWTQGCIAMRNADIKELFDALNTKTPVTIKP